MELSSLKESKEHFINHLKTNRKSSSTCSTYDYNLSRMIDYINDKYDDFNIKTAIFDYIDNINDEYKASTINNIRSSIRSFISFLYKRGYIDEDFSGDIEFIKLDTTPKTILEPQDIEKIYDFLINEVKEATGYKIYTKVRNLLLFYFLLHTGVRRHELVKLKWEDINFLTNTITLQGKGNKTRVIPLLPDLKQQLYTFKDIIEKLDNNGHNVKSEYIFRTEKKNKTTGLKDKPMTGKNVEIIVKDICNKAGVEKNVSPHILRHTFASYAIKNKINIPSLSDILGHSNNTITLNIYAHEISMEEKRKEMSKINFNI